MSEGVWEDYESNGNRYSVLVNQYTMRFGGIPVVRLHPETFAPNGKKAWGGRRLGKSVKRTTHYFTIGSETSLCNKPHIRTHQKTMENRAGQKTIFSQDDFAWPIEAHSVMSNYSDDICKSCLKALAKDDENDDAIQAWVNVCGVSV